MSQLAFIFHWFGLSEESPIYDGSFGQKCTPTYCVDNLTRLVHTRHDVPHRNEQQWQHSFLSKFDDRYFYMSRFNESPENVHLDNDNTV